MTTSTAPAPILSVYEIVGSSHPITSSSGRKLLEAAQTALAIHSRIVLDFSGIEGLATAVCHLSLGNLYLQMGADVAAKRIGVAGIENENVLKSVWSAVDLGSKPHRVEALHNALDRMIADF